MLDLSGNLHALRIHLFCKVLADDQSSVLVDEHENVSLLQAELRPHLFRDCHLEFVSELACP